jgi:hypothetical protein
VVRRWQAGESQRGIARATGLARETVNKYLAAAGTLGLVANGPPPSAEQVAALVRLGTVVRAPRTWAAPGRDALEPYAERIRSWVQQDHLQLARVHELLAQDGVRCSYMTLPPPPGPLDMTHRLHAADRIQESAEDLEISSQVVWRRRGPVQVDVFSATGVEAAGRLQRLHLRRRDPPLRDENTWHRADDLRLVVLVVPHANLTVVPERKVVQRQRCAFRFHRRASLDGQHI